jgi:hypothetical protein
MRRHSYMFLLQWFNSDIHHLLRDPKRRWLLCQDRKRDSVFSRSYRLCYRNERIRGHFGLAHHHL